MNIIISQSMTQQQSSVHLGNTNRGICIITCGILLRRTHETLSIDRVVETPIRGRGNSNTCLKDRTTLTHTHQGVETTEAPSPDTDIILVNIGKRTQIDSCLYLIAGLQFSQLFINTFLKVCPTCSCATTINANDNKTFLTQISIIHTTGSHAAHTPRILYLLTARATILPHHNGIFL